MPPIVTRNSTMNCQGSRIAAMRDPWQFMVLFLVTIGGIYAGIFSPTEAAAIGAAGAILIGAVGRRLTRAALLRSIENTVVTSGILFVIVFGANLFSFFMVQTHLPDLMADAARALHLPGPAVIVLI